MRFKYLKYLAFVLGGLSTVVAAGALYLYATFDGVRLAAELTHFAKQRYQRSLRIDGPVVQWDSHPHLRGQPERPWRMGPPRHASDVDLHRHRHGDAPKAQVLATCCVEINDRSGIWLTRWVGKCAWLRVQAGCAQPGGASRSPGPAAQQDMCWPGRGGKMPTYVRTG